MFPPETRLWHRQYMFLPFSVVSTECFRSLSLHHKLLSSLQLLALQIKPTNALCLGTDPNNLYYFKIPTCFGPRRAIIKASEQSYKKRTRWRQRDLSLCVAFCLVCQWRRTWCAAVDRDTFVRSVWHRVGTLMTQTFRTNVLLPSPGWGSHVHPDTDTRALLKDSHLEETCSVRIAKAVGVALKAKQTVWHLDRQYRWAHRRVIKRSVAQYECSRSG